MNATARTLVSVLVGAVALLGGTAACATPHTIDGYIADVRSSMDDYESRNTADSQIVAVGQGMCSYPESLNTDFAAESDMTPRQQEDFKLLADTTRGYCDVLGSTPAPGGDPGGFGDSVVSSAVEPVAPVAIPPMPIEVGVPVGINYGGEDVLTYTFDKVSRCGSNLALDVTIKTGEFASHTDGLIMSADFVGADGVTRMVTEAYDYTCTDAAGELPFMSDRQPERTYKGRVLYAVPAGQDGTLNLYGSDGVTRTLAISGS